MNKTKQIHDIFEFQQNNNESNDTLNVDTETPTKRKRKARNGVCTSGLLANPVFFFIHILVCFSRKGERERE